MSLSVVVPLYNEQDNVQPLRDALVGALEEFTGQFEVILVDDGSTDATFELARQLAAADRRFRVVKFRGNFGQTPAMAAGIDLARGEVIVTMDGDLQNDPRDIPLLLDRIREGYDIVVGWRYRRQDKFLSRKVPSRIANWLIGKITGVPIKDNGCSLKAYRADVIKAVPLYSEMHRFIPAMASITGARIAELKVRHHARRFGESKYGLSRIYKVLLDVVAIKTVISFSSRPMIWFAAIALPFALLSTILLAVAFYGFAASGALSLSVAGAGVLFAAVPIVLLLGGALAELVFRFGDVKDHELAGLTIRRHRRQ